MTVSLYGQIVSLYERSAGEQDVRGRDASGPEAAERRRWLILVVGLIAMTAGCTYQYGLAYLIPALRHEGFSLEGRKHAGGLPDRGLVAHAHRLGRGRRP